VRSPKPTERQVQRAILKMAGICFPDVLIAHVPNGAHLSGDDRARCMQMGALKGDGLKIGFPDLIAIWNHGVAFLEVKRPGGKLSPHQTLMHVKLNQLGFTPAVVTSPEEAFAFLVDRGAPTRVREYGREAA
jgi:hypothetical protein